MATPDVDDVLEYLGATSYTSDEVQSALDAETAAQAGVCDIPDDMPADLAEALKRRVARNLAMRAEPHITVPGDVPVITPSRDPEVRRLEGPHRRMVMG